MRPPSIPDSSPGMTQTCNDLLLRAREADLDRDRFQEVHRILSCEYLLPSTVLSEGAKNDSTILCSCLTVFLGHSVMCLHRCPNHQYSKRTTALPVAQQQ